MGEKSFNHSFSSINNDYPTISKYIIVPKQSDYTSSILHQLSKQKNIKICNPEQFCHSQSPFTEKDKLYLSSDTLYPLIRSKLNRQLATTIETFRNKYLFRQLLKNVFPHYFFDSVDLDNLVDYQFDCTKCNKYIVKPCTGFMGGAVKIIDDQSDLREIHKSLEKELESFSRHYPNIFSTKFIIEEYIQSANEYAVDMYYDHQGRPVVINIYCHPDAKRIEYLQMLYYTSAEIFESFHDNIIDFFTELNTILGLRCFPIHAEFKINESNQLFPIEFNPARFGGMGLCDLTYYAFNFHPIQAYFRNEKPNWQEIWSKNDSQMFCWVLGYNAADRNLKTHAPDHDLFKELLPKTICLLGYEKLNYESLPAFAIVYLSTSNKDDIESILNIEFNDCFRLKTVRRDSDVTNKMDLIVNL